MSAHNPDNLTEAQIGRGWRLLHVSELKRREPTNAIQTWYRGAQEWEGKTRWEGRNPRNTYRTKLSPHELSIDRPPPARVIIMSSTRVLRIGAHTK